MIDDKEDFQIDAKELEFNDQTEIKIEKEDVLKNIDKDSEKIEIDNINDALKVQTVLEKLKKTAFTKLELLSINNLNIDSLEFLNNECFKSLIVLEIKHTKITSLDKLNEAPLAELKVLDLSLNEIDSIAALTQCPFKNLEILNLAENKNIKEVKPIADAGYPTFVYEIPENITEQDSTDKALELFELMYNIVKK